MKELILASASPRRAALLEIVGIPLRIVESRISERGELPAEPAAFAVTLSERKARQVAEQVKGGPVLGADTIVVLDGTILGKPRNASHAEQMLHWLSGRPHEVITGLTLISADGGEQISAHESTRVFFRTLNAEEISEYVRTGEPMDKAGAYGIQGKGALLVERIEGCYYNVVGLPLVRLMKMLKALAPDGKGAIS